MIRRRLSHRRFMREHRWVSVRVDAYLDGEMVPAERHRLEAHVGLCPECRRMIAALKRTLAGLMALPPPAPPDRLAGDIIDRLGEESST